MGEGGGYAGRQSAPAGRSKWKQDAAMWLQQLAYARALCFRPYAAPYRFHAARFEPQATPARWDPAGSSSTRERDQQGGRGWG